MGYTFHHVHLRCEDLEATVDFYTKMFDLPTRILCAITEKTTGLDEMWFCEPSRTHLKIVGKTQIFHIFSLDTSVRINVIRNLQK